MIKKVTVFKNNKGNLKTVVRYENGRTRTFTHNDTQPRTVVMFKLNSKNVETVTTETGTITYYK